MDNNTITIVLAVLAGLGSATAVFVGAVKSAGELRKSEDDRKAALKLQPVNAEKAVFDSRKAELEMIDRFREVAGGMIQDLRDEVTALRVQIRERDEQIGKIEERQRALFAEGRQMRAGLEEALEIARKAYANDVNNGIMSSIVAILECALQPIPTKQDTQPLPPKDKS